MLTLRGCESLGPMCQRLCLEAFAGKYSNFLIKAACVSLVFCQKFRYFLSEQVVMQLFRHLSISKLKLNLRKIERFTWNSFNKENFITKTNYVSNSPSVVFDLWNRILSEMLILKNIISDNVILIYLVQFKRFSGML